jgi:prepilin-type N-terminal cleavage/methylation domain-containing protein
MNGREPRSGRAFTLAEIILSIAVMGIIAMVVYPVLAIKLRGSQTSALSQTFAGLAQSIAEFKRATTRYPSSLVFLSKPPAGTDLDICNAQITTANADRWRGPYTTMVISSNGINVADATIAAALRPVSGVGGNPTFLMIDAAAVRTEIADELESQLDGDANGVSGVIRYTTSGVGSIGTAPTGTYNVSYAIPRLAC